MKIAVPVLTLMLAGCAANFIKDMETGLQPFVGKDIHVAIKKLGYPAGEKTIAGDKVFTWSTLQPGTTEAQGSWCTVELITDEADRVRTFQWSGDRRGCGPFEDILEQ